MPDWTPQTPLRVVTGYQNVARAFFEAKGFTDRVALLGAMRIWAVVPCLFFQGILSWSDSLIRVITMAPRQWGEISGQ